jgi:hypothetical protein
MLKQFAFAIALWVAADACPSGATRPQPDAEPIYPQPHWQGVDRPESAGFSSRRLAALRVWMESLDTTAMLVAAGGRTLFTYGDVTHGM